MPKGIPKNGANKGWFKKGQKHSKEWYESMRNRIPWNKNKKGIHLSPKTEFKKGDEVNLGKHWKIAEEKRINMRRNTWKGKENPAWVDGRARGIYPIDWTETLKRAIRERDHYICQLCNQYGNEIHHIDYNKKNCDPNNLINLCHSCHSKTNFNRNRWKNLFNNNFNTKKNK